MADFIVNSNILKENYIKLKSRIHCDKMFYALKANGNDCVLKVLDDIEANFEISSSGELKALKNLNVPSERIISSIPIKTRDFVIEAYEYGIRYFVFECIEEFEKLEKYAKEAKKILRIYISDLDSESYKWGMTEEQIVSLKANNYDLFEKVDGLTFHISRNYQLKMIGSVLDRIEKVLDMFELNKEFIVNIGGGYRNELPIHLAYKYNLNAFYEKLNNRIHNLKEKYNIRFYCEPGRGIVDTACDIILKVEQSSVRNGGNYAFINLNAYNLGTLPTKINILNKDNEKECIYDESWIFDRSVKREKIYFVFMDTICEWKEFMRLPLEKRLNEGDIIELKGVGAYSVALSSHFHLRDRLRSNICCKEGTK